MPRGPKQVKRMLSFQFCLTQGVVRWNYLRQVNWYARNRRTYKDCLVLSLHQNDLQKDEQFRADLTGNISTDLCKKLCNKLGYVPWNSDIKLCYKSRKFKTGTRYVPGYSSKFPQVLIENCRKLSLNTVSVSLTYFCITTSW